MKIVDLVVPLVSGVVPSRRGGRASFLFGFWRLVSILLFVCDVLASMFALFRILLVLFFVLF